MKNNSLTYKVFRNTLIMLLLNFVLIYGILYFLLPSAYSNYIKNKVDISYNEIMYDLEQENYSDVVNKINDKINDDIDVQISTSTGKVIFPINQLDIDLVPRAIDITKIKTIKKPDIVAKSGVFTFDNKSLILRVSTLKSGINDVRSSIFGLIPLILMVVFIMALIIAFIFSKMIVSPILKIHKKANEISLLNFDNKIVVKQNNEIGDLSKCLDEMSYKLKTAITHLEADVAEADLREIERINYMATVSHELKTPLTIIKGQNECMLNNIGDFKNHNKYLVENIIIIEQLENLVNEILESSKLDNFNIKLSVVKINLKELIQELIQEQDYLIKQNNLNIKLNLEEYYITIDIDVFSKAIKNLLENSIKYANKNSSINIELKKDIFKITNIANNLDTLDVITIFNPFVRGEQSRNSTTGGHGLGLYIVQKAIYAHNYNIKAVINNNEISFIINFKR